MTTSLFIKSRVRKDGTTKIFVRYTYKGERFYFDTGIYIPVKYFDKETNTIKPSYKSVDVNMYYDYKKILQQKRLEIDKIVIDLQLLNIEPTIENVRLSYLNYGKKEQPNPIIESVKKDIPYDVKLKSEGNKKYNFFDILDTYLKDMGRSNVYKKTTLGTYQSSISRLKKFSKEKSYPITFNSINEIFYNDFCEWCYNKKLTDNSTDTTIKHIKKFMNYTLNKYHSNTGFLTFKRKTRLGEVITLEHDEIVKILMYKPKNKKEEQLKDVIILHLGTGLRVADLVSLTSGNFVVDYSLDNIKLIRKRAILKLELEKSEEDIRIPINDMVWDLIEKYDIVRSGKMDFNKINKLEYNNFIKKVCESVGINRIVRKVMYRGHEKVIIESEKYNFITSHILRKSFISYALKGNNAEKVMSVSGHKSWNAFKRYVNIADDTKKEVVEIFNSPYQTSLKNSKK